MSRHQDQKSFLIPHELLQNVTKNNFVLIDHNRINSNLNTYQLHATDEGQGAPAATAPHGVLLPPSLQRSTWRRNSG